MHDPSRDPAKANLYHSYVKGWKDGASVRPIDPRFKDHLDRSIWAEYERGYEDGYTARVTAWANAAARIGYEPSILRTERV